MGYFRKDREFIRSWPAWPEVIYRGSRGYPFCGTLFGALSPAGIFSSPRGGFHSCRISALDLML